MNKSKATEAKNSGPVRIAVTGATGEISELVILMLSRGDLFGPNTSVDLTLLVSKKELYKLTKGTMVELGMCNLQPLKRVRGTTNISEAFKDAQYIIVGSGVPANFGFSRNDLIGSNCRELKDVGIALRAVEKTVKVLVVTAPQNINIQILQHFAPNLSPQQITGISRVDHNRSVVKLAKMLDITTSKVTRVSVFGNSGAKVFPDLRHGRVEKLGKALGVYEAFGDDYYLKYDFVRDIHNRNEELYKRCHTGPYLSTANAVIQHMRDWIFGTPKDTWTSMVVISDGSYGIDKGMPFSFPVRVDQKGKLEIVSDLDLDLFEKERVAEAAEHYLKEKELAWATMGLTNTQDNEERVPLTWSFGCNVPVPCRVLGPLERQRMNYF